MCKAPIALAAFVLAASPAVLDARQHWVPAVAHAAGAAGSVWRSDVSVVNLCPVPATVELRLHSAAGIASARCLARGAELTSLHDHPTFLHLNLVLIERLGVDQAWIGLSDRESEGTFVWSDGSPLDLELWGSGSPKPSGDVEDCVATAPWGWSDLPCDRRLPFVCRPRE
jgi:hypothetical protein